MEGEEMDTECEKEAVEAENSSADVKQVEVEIVESATKGEEDAEEEEEEEEEATNELDAKAESAEENSNLEEESESEDRTEESEERTYEPYSPHDALYAAGLKPEPEGQQEEEEEEEQQDEEGNEEGEDDGEGVDGGEEVKIEEEKGPEPSAQDENKSAKLQSRPAETASNEASAENGKKKGKEEKPPTKVIVRRLPPSMTFKTFLEQVSPLPPVDYSYFVQADMAMGVNAFSRAYLNFVNQDDLFSFTRTFDNYVFLDAKGQEYPAIVEFAPFQRVPKQRNTKKKDPLCSTIEADPAYITFKENMLAEALENSKPGANTVKQHYFETENVTSTQEVSTTPLLEFLKIKRAEKARMKEERREEKRRKEAERKLKQKAKEKKLEAGGDSEEMPPHTEVKVLQPVKDKKDGRDKDGKMIKRKDREEKDKPNREKQASENRPREFKSRSGKSYQEERQKQIERREEQKKKSALAGVNAEGGGGGGTAEEGAGGGGESWPSINEGKKNQQPPQIVEKKRVFESKRNSRSESESGQQNYKGDAADHKKRNDRVFVKRDRKDDAYSTRRRNTRDKKNAETSTPADRRRTKVYKNSQHDSYNKKESTAHGQQAKKEGQEEKSADETRKSKHPPYWKENALVFRRRNSLGSKGKGDSAGSEEAGGQVQAAEKRRNSTGSDNPPSERLKDGGNADAEQLAEREVGDRKEAEKKESASAGGAGGGGGAAATAAAPGAKLRETDKKDLKEEGGHPKSTKDPRTERRIRNKDRPSIEIYRPGMGKFSKQRLEKEKALGSSTEVDSPSHSPSPTPKAAKSSTVTN